MSRRFIVFFAYTNALDHSRHSGESDIVWPAAGFPQRDKLIAAYYIQLTEQRFPVARGSLHFTGILPVTEEEVGEWKKDIGGTEAALGITTQTGPLLAPTDPLAVLAAEHHPPDRKRRRQNDTGENDKH